ncbi:SHOCT domain-containing protein [Rhizobium sp. G21]|nr:SHOCT domain-containing protein [Rhizobium sp. G21]MBB1251744.1 SHOCT domain-containing protein [Rhizobium sp. G21]
MAAGKIARDMRANREDTTLIEAQPVEAHRSVADEIAKLADLLNAGHLTQAEFDQRKGQLLSQA